MLDAGRYKANFTRGGLMVPESRIVADLLLADADADGWRQAIEVDNVLAKRSVSTAATKATLIRGRLKTLPPALWVVIRDGSTPAATHAVLAGVINYSPGIFLTSRLPGFLTSQLPVYPLTTNHEYHALPRAHHPRAWQTWRKALCARSSLHGLRRPRSACGGFVRG
jgi:hypothetical protein